MLDDDPGCDITFDHDDVTFGEGPACPVCGEEMAWADCWNCGGEGSFDGYEQDPLWYDQGDEIVCPHCDGKGGWYICVNKACHAEMPVEIPPEQLQKDS